MRMAFRLEGGSPDDFERSFVAEVAEPFGMEWRLAYPDEPRRVAVLVSREEHCLLDLLWRARRGDFDAQIVHVISNHPDHETDVAAFGVPYTHIPFGDDPSAAEDQMAAVLAGNVELVVLARYMRILSGGFLERVGCRSSTFITRSSLHFPEQSLTLAPPSGRQDHRRDRPSSPKSSTRARSSSRTSRACRIAIRPRSWQRSVATSNGSSLHVQSGGTCRTA
jgi:hypothetical protein